MPQPSGYVLYQTRPNRKSTGIDMPTAVVDGISISAFIPEKTALPT
jgi:hypothetical protein